MEQRKNKPMWILFLILLILFFAGMACEIGLKYWSAALAGGPAKPAWYLTRRVLIGFGDEATPIWLIPTVVLNWMMLLPRDAGAVMSYALRWMPYLVVFLFPAFGALFRKKQIPLIFCAILACIETVGIVLAVLVRHYPMLTWFHAIPFAVELILLILACIALGANKKGFAITLGVFCVLFALISPTMSAVLAELRGSTLASGFPLGPYLRSVIRRLPLFAAVSAWPVFKAFAFLMYALLLFVGASRFRKNA